MRGGIISVVEPESIAEEIGLQPGDELVSINEHIIRDIIDYRFYSAEEEVELEVKRGGESLFYLIEKDFDDPIGVDFSEELFDGVRTCGNACIFCFVNQLPRGMRKSLYIKDDDYRLSFLHGNFVTLANITDNDIDRIVEQRLTPLYVSVHTTDPELRTEMLGSERGEKILHQLKRLAEAKITLHTQIVLCPGVNDGAQLDKTITDLAGYYPAVASIAAVPVGLTAHRRGKHLGTYDPDSAAEIVSQVKNWQRKFLREKGERLVFISDEFYLTAGVPVPSARVYEGFPQIENGVGLVRQFLDKEKRVLKKLPDKLIHPVRGTVITGILAKPLIDEFISHLNSVGGLDLKVLAVQNDFFGRSVTVTGLLTGRDIVSAIESSVDPVETIFLPSICLRDGVFLDDMSVDDLAAKVKRPIVVFHPNPISMFSAILDIAHN